MIEFEPCSLCLKETFHVPTNDTNLMIYLIAQSTQRWILARIRKDEDIGVMPTTNTLIRPISN